jgi:homoserine dehydrogenase
MLRATCAPIALRAASEPGKQASAYVRLESLPSSDPLYALTGFDAAVTFQTDKMGPVSIVSTTPTIEDTAYGEFADMLRACRPTPV